MSDFSLPAIPTTQCFNVSMQPYQSPSVSPSGRPWLEVDDEVQMWQNHKSKVILKYDRWKPRVTGSKYKVTNATQKSAALIKRQEELMLHVQGLEARCRELCLASRPTTVATTSSKKETVIMPLDPAKEALQVQCLQVFHAKPQFAEKKKKQKGKAAKAAQESVPEPEEGEELQVPNPGLQPELFAAVLALRTERLQIEQETAKIQDIQEISRKRSKLASTMQRITDYCFGDAAVALQKCDTSLQEKVSLQQSADMEWAKANGSPMVESKSKKKK